MYGYISAEPTVLNMIQKPLRRVETRRYKMYRADGSSQSDESIGGPIGAHIGRKSKTPDTAQ